MDYQRVMSNMLLTDYAIGSRKIRQGEETRAGGIIVRLQAMRPLMYTVIVSSLLLQKLGGWSHGLPGIEMEWLFNIMGRGCNEAK